MALTDFHDVTLDTYFSLNARAKVRFMTAVHQMREGHEERVGSWQDPLREYNLTPALRDQADLNSLIAFWRARLGIRYTFKLVDPLDSVVTNSQFGIGNTTQTVYQLCKRYTSGVSGDTHTYIRPIVLPDSAGIHIYGDDVEITTGFVIDYESGVITFTPAPTAVVLTWTGTFKVPVNFSVNRLFPTIEMYERFEAPITLIEARTPVHANIMAETEVDDFVEARFPSGFAERSSIGPEFYAIEIPSDTGGASRVSQFIEPKLYFSVSKTAKNFSAMTQILNFFLCRKGRLVGHRIEDITDFQATSMQFGAGNGTQTLFQLTKTYTSGGESQVRTIEKPVAGSFTVYGDATPFAQQPTVDITNGDVLFTLGSITLTFTAATKRLVRSAGSWTAQGVVSGSKLIVSGSVSNNATFTVVTVHSTVEVEVSETVVDEGPIACTVLHPPGSGVVLTWTGEFDVPVRADADELEFAIIGYGDDGLGVYNMEALSFTEIRTTLPAVTYNAITGPISILSGCSVQPLRDFEEVTHYAQFLGSDFLIPPTTSHFSLFFVGAYSITFACLISHAVSGTLINHDQFDGAQAFAVSGIGGTIGLKSAVGGALLTGTGIGGSPAVGFCLSSQTIPFSSSFSDNSSSVLAEMHAYVVTMDFANRSSYASGSAHGKSTLASGASSKFAYDLCTRAGILSTPPVIISVDTLFYYGDREYGNGFNDGQLGGIGIFPNSALIADGFEGRLYEFAIMVNRIATAERVIINLGHKPILQYWASKYGGGYKRRQGFQLIGDSGYWRAGDHITVGGGNQIQLWPSGSGVGNNDGGMGGFDWKDNVGLVELVSIPFLDLPVLNDTLYLADGRKLPRD